MQLRGTGFAASSLLLLVISCQPAPDLEAARLSLMEADRAFARSVADRRLEAWVEAFDTAGIQMRPNLPFTPGHDEIRRLMTPAFADTSWHLSWEPRWHSSAHPLTSAIRSGRIGACGAIRSARNAPGQGNTSRSGGSSPTADGKSCSTAAIPTPPLDRVPWYRHPAGMPIYEYRCGSCGAEFDLLVRSDTVLACPACQGTRLDRKLSLTARPAAGRTTGDFSQLGPPPGGCCGGGACHNH